MKIRMKTGLSGPQFSLAPGDTKDFADDGEAQRLIDAKFAERVTETAITPAPIEETTAERITRLEAELAEAKASLPTDAKPLEPDATGPAAPAPAPAPAPASPAAAKPSNGKASSKTAGSQA